MRNTKLRGWEVEISNAVVSFASSQLRSFPTSAYYLRSLSGRNGMVSMPGMVRMQTVKKKA